MSRKKCEDLIHELLRMGAEDEGMFHAGHDPQFSLRINLMQKLGMPHSDVSVGRAVNEQNRSADAGDCRLWAYALQVEPVHDAALEKSAFNGGAQQCFPQPGSG